MACLIRRLDGIKRLKAKQPENSMQNFCLQELREYQRESYQFRIKLGRLRQLRYEGSIGNGNGNIGANLGINLNNFMDKKNGLRYNF